MKSLLSAILIFLSLTVATVSVDAVIVRGTIVDAETGEPLVGACVLKKVGDSVYRESRCLTDIDGNFVIEVSDNDSIKVAYIGYIPVTISVDSVAIISLDLVHKPKVSGYDKYDWIPNSVDWPRWSVDGIALSDSVFSLAPEKLRSKYAKELVCAWLPQLTPEMISEIKATDGYIHWGYQRGSVDVSTTHRDIPFIVNGDTIIAKDAGMGIFFNRKALMDYITIHAADFGITTPVDTIIPSTTPMPQVVVLLEKSNTL